MKRNIKLFEEFINQIPKVGRFHGRIDKSKLSRNSDGTYDYDGHLNFSNMRLKSLNEIPIRFKNVNGNFDCNDNYLVSLEGAPETVKGDFHCHYNNLVSLEGAPREVQGDFDCGNNQLESLEGTPNTINGHLWCGYNKLESLKGAPEEIQGGFHCHNNQLQSLEGAPREVQGDFICYNNKLVTLEGAPSIIKVDFWCYRNNLISDKHLSKVNGNFDSYPNPLGKTKGVIESISKMSNETQMKQLNFLGKVDIKAYDIFLEILEELGVDVSVRKELANISKSSGLDDIGF
jgi:hypothetical protein